MKIKQVLGMANKVSDYHKYMLDPNDASQISFWHQTPILCKDYFRFSGGWHCELSFNIRLCSFSLITLWCQLKAHNYRMENTVHGSDRQTLTLSIQIRNDVYLIHVLFCATPASHCFRVNEHIRVVYTPATSPQIERKIYLIPVPWVALIRGRKPLRGALSLPSKARTK